MNVIPNIHSINISQTPKMLPTHLKNAFIHKQPSFVSGARKLKGTQLNIASPS